MTNQIEYDVYEHLLNNKEAILFELDVPQIEAKNYIKTLIIETFNLTIEETLVIMEADSIKFIISNYFSKKVQEIT